MTEKKKEPKDEKAESAKIEKKQSELFQIQNDIKMTIQSSMDFMESFKEFCQIGASFFEANQEEKKLTKRNNNIVLYRKRSLSEILEEEKRTAKQVPKAIESIINELKERGIVEGIFRLSAHNARVDEIMNRLSLTNFKELTPIELGAILKKFVHDLPDGVFSDFLQQSIINVWEGMKSESVEVKTKQVCFMIQNQCSEESFTLFKEIMKLNLYIHQHSDVTLMNSMNLSVCWTPSFFDLVQFLTDLNTFKDVISSVIMNADTCFAFEY